MSQPQAPQTGLEDVVAAVRTLTRSGLSLIESGGDVLERELSMVVKLSEQLRDRVVKPETLDGARSNEFYSRLRADAHQLVDVLADAGTVAVLSAIELATQVAEELPPAVRKADAGAPA